MTAAISQTEYAPLDQDAWKHCSLLTKCLHSAHPVMVDGKVGYIQAISASLAGGHIETTVYLTGNPAPIDSSKVALYEEAV